jgi:hypothetical protein
VSAAPARAYLAAVALGSLLAAGCAPRPFLARAIAARGGPLASVVREVEADVHVAFPGRWRWRTVFLAPDRYALTIHTTSEPDHYVWDGTAALAFVGERLVARDPTLAAPLRTQARFTAVANLDTLALPGIDLEVTPAAAGAGEVVTEVVAVFTDDGSRYRLGFDRDDLLRTVEGPVSLPPLGPGVLAATFTDFRRAGGLRLPARTSYVFAGRPLLDERALAICPNVAGLGPAAFRAPTTLPDCGGAGGTSSVPPALARQKPGTFAAFL